MQKAYRGLELFINSKMIRRGFVDTEGRPIAEGKCLEPLKGTFNLEYTACPFTGSRATSKKLMNKTAMDRVHSNWSEIVGHLQFYRSLYKSYIKVDGPLSIFQAWRFSESLTQMNLYMKFMHGNSYEINPLSADLYKVVLGASMMLRDLSLDGYVSQVLDANDILTSQAVFEYIEDKHLLVGRAESCPAPDHLVMELIDELIGKESSESKSDIASVVGAHDLADFSRFMQFSTVDFFVHLVKVLYIQTYLMCVMSRKKSFSPDEIELGFFIGVNIESQHWKNQIRIFRKAILKNENGLAVIFQYSEKKTQAMIKSLIPSRHNLQELHKVEESLANILDWLDREVLGYKFTVGRKEFLLREFQKIWGVPSH